jgi:hypothetical protein
LKSAEEQESIMAADPRKRQKKLEQRAAKRKEKKHVQIREQSLGMSERLSVATQYPILGAWVGDDLWTQGLGTVHVSRELGRGMVAASVFLIDRYCLGVKDAFARILNRAEYDSTLVRKVRSKFPTTDVSPAKARKIVEAAVEYASGLGFPPPADYQVAKLIFGDIDAGECTEEFEFGKNGKPLFINGPNDTIERCNLIQKTLERTQGPGGFEFIIRLGPKGAIKPNELGLVMDSED